MLPRACSTGVSVSKDLFLVCVSVCGCVPPCKVQQYCAMFLRRESVCCIGQSCDVIHWPSLFTDDSEIPLRVSAWLLEYL